MKHALYVFNGSLCPSSICTLMDVMDALIRYRYVGGRLDSSDQSRE